MVTKMSSNETKRDVMVIYQVHVLIYFFRVRINLGNIATNNHFIHKPNDRFLFCFLSIFYSC